MTAEIASLWIPPTVIRPVAIGVARRDDLLLVMRVVDGDGRLTGVRPPGGGIEFGETAEAAVVREYREELGVMIRVTGDPRVFESHFRFNGHPGHEIVFAFPIDPLGLPEPGPPTLVTDNSGQMRVEWLPLGPLRTGAIALFPPGLLATLD